MNLWQILNDKKPIKVYLDSIDFGIMTYNEKLKRYENQYGNIPIEKIPDILEEKEYVNHIKLESVEE